MHYIGNKTEMFKAIDLLCTHERLAHDTETKGVYHEGISGLFPFHGARSFAHIFATKDEEYYFDFNTGGINPKYKKELQPIFDDEKRIIFYCNAEFDNSIMHFDNLKNHARIMDLASLARIEWNEHGKIEGAEETFLSLEYLAEHYGAQAKIDAVKIYIKENGLYAEKPCSITGEKIPMFDKVPLEIMFPYGCGDGRTTYDVGEKIIQCINYKDVQYENENPYTQKMINVAAQESKVMPVVIDMKLNGFDVDIEYCNKAMAREQEIVDRSEAALRKDIGDINLNSPKQVGDLLEKRGVEVRRKPLTKSALKQIAKLQDDLRTATPKKAELIKQKIEEKRKGNYHLDKKQLQKIIDANMHLDFLALISVVKQATKKINTYYKNFIAMSDANGVLHCNLNPNTTKTGRFSASMPNLQNLHKEKWLDDDGNIVGEWNIRNALTCFDEDFDLFFFDYEQQEMIVMLDQAGEMGVIEKLKSGEYKDFYLATAAVIKEVTGKEFSRQQAKAIALGLAYGQGAGLLATNLGISLEEAKELIYTFFRALPKLKAFSDQLKFQVEMRGKIHNPFGRVSYIEKEKSYKALNSFVQGSSADITKKALIDIYWHLKNNNYRSKLVLTVHDEIIVRMHKDERHLVPVIQKLMCDAYEYIHVPLATGVEIGKKAWGQKYDYDYALAS